MTPPPAPFILPTIHLNGTSSADLVEGYLSALRAVQDAQDAIRRIEFNARDYYPQGDSAWPAARDQMSARMMALAAIHSDFEQILMHIQDAG